MAASRLVDELQQLVNATVPLLTELGRISQRIMAALLRDLSGLTISDGQISRLQTKCNDPKTAETCRRLGNACASLCVFATHDGVSSTNNIAEQTPRKAVIFRKLSFSTEEQTGRRNLSVIFSTVETCRRQGPSAIAWVREAVANLFAGKTSPGFLLAG